MEDFANALSRWILDRETPTLKNIMGEVAYNIQMDIVKQTYQLIDMYYQDYRPEVYIRTDELTKQKKGKDGKFKKKTTNERRRLENKDVSLKAAIEELNASKQPAIGVCQPFKKGVGYQAGIIFNSNYFEEKMQHSVKGRNFTEWDIAENFLYGIHGNSERHNTTPDANTVLSNYINSYQTQFYKHYQTAYNKYRK